MKAQFIIYADFEANNVPIHGCDPKHDVSITTKKTHHQVTGFTFVTVSPFFPPKYKTYRGEDAGEVFLKCMLKERKRIFEIEEKPLVMSDEDEANFLKAKKCHICKEGFIPEICGDESVNLGKIDIDLEYTEEEIEVLTKKGEKVRDHCHYSGVF